MTIVETPQQMINHLKNCEAAAINEPDKRKRYKMLREWLEELVKLRVDNVLLKSQLDSIKQSNHILTSCLSNKV